jgi:D-amino-acid dehydrogenase
VSDKRRPQHVAVIGAGMLGLCTAWFLQQQGLRAIAARSPAIHLPALPGPALLSFLVRFARNCTPRRRDAAQTVLGLLSGQAMAAFDALTVGGVDALVSSDCSVIAAYQDPAGRAPLVAELEHVARRAGPRVDYDLLDGAAVLQAEPVLGPGARAAVRIHGQRYMDPAAFISALATSVRRRGSQIRPGTEVIGLRDDGVASPSPAVLPVARLAAAGGPAAASGGRQR